MTSSLLHPRRVEILKVPFDQISLDQATELVLEKVRSFSGHAFFIATPNPEMLLEAQKNQKFLQLLRHTDLNIPDGTGIIFASKTQKISLAQRVTGTDLLQEICRKASSPLKIFLLGAAPGVAEKAAFQLQKLNRNVRVVGTFSGSPAVEAEAEIRRTIVESQAELLLVAFGAPRQEFWLQRNLPFLPNIKVAMGVGGAFDFLAGVRKRAPLWIRNLGLEWLFRLFQEPTRFRRIYHATIKFPLVFLVDTFFIPKNSDFKKKR